MTQLIIDKKKYVILPVKEYEVLQKKAALKSKPEKLFSIDEARAYSKKLINKWAAGK
jgi:PHD/YefM family antitoxin component YafN of YafNO toxin-antitoxin module